MQRAFFSSLFFALPLACFSGLIPLSVAAQVSPDGTTATTVNQNGNNFAIEQGDRVGDNLFHSFNEFSVPTGGSAVFNNAGDITNIFSRVTGSSISNIDGTLGANGTANLYLINPNGIIFGENARLNLGGSFFASTADSLLFEGDAEFSAVNPQAVPLLEVSIPIGLSFRDNPGSITNQPALINDAENPSGLEVDAGKNITLLGGDINLDAFNLTARGGNIELGGLSEAGTVNLNNNGTLSFAENIALADITLSNAGEADVMGTGNGNILVNARNLNLIAASRLRAGLTEDSTLADAQAGNITVNVTENINQDGGRITNNVNRDAVGNGGNINITAGNIALTNGADIGANTFGQGNAGLVEIANANNITVDGEDTDGFASRITSGIVSGAIGDALGVRINANSLTLTNGGQVNGSTFGQGNAGLVEINAIDFITIDGETSEASSSGIFSSVASEDTVGNAAGVVITTNNLTLTDGGQIDTSTFGQGNAGLVEINASDSITIDGETSDSFSSGVFSTVQDTAVGNSGNLAITTVNLTLANGGQLSTNTSGQGDAGIIEITAIDNVVIDGVSPARTISGISSETSFTSTGSSADINVTTNNLDLKNGGQISTSTSAEGNAGNVVITAGDNVVIDGADSVNFFLNSKIVSESSIGEGDAGDLTITANNLTLTNGGQVSADTSGQGNAGSIDVNVDDTISIAGNIFGAASGIFSTSSSSFTRDENAGDAGDITIATNDLNFADGGRISTSTSGQGNAGLINVNVNDTINIDGESIRLPSGIVSEATPNAEGSAGSININTKILSLFNGAEVSASTSGVGNAGFIEITADDSITIDGEDSSGFGRSNVTSEISFEAKGDAGGIIIATNSLSLTDGGFISANSFGQGDAGNINIGTNSLDLNNRARINAVTRSETGNSANIDLTIAEDIILENNSLISAEALENATGGNVTIDANNGFILAFPNQNNDIIANASEGRGGAINIDTEAIFGLEERPLNSLTNDINASSEADGLDGTIDINNPAVDPTTGLINLPASVSNASDQISQNPCQQGIGSQFIVTGKGGLPPNPTENLQSDRITVDLVEPLPREGETGTLGEQKTREEDIVTARVPAMGWVFNEKGEVTLTAYSNTDAERERSPQYSTSCQSNLTP